MDVQPLKLFNDRARRLEESDFYHWLLAQKPRRTPEDLSSKDWVKREGLSPGALDAFCLNLRLLVQDQDGFSLRCLSRIYADLPAEAAKVKEFFEGERAKLQQFLGQRSMIQLDNGETKNADYFDLIFYGGIAHSNKKYLDEFERWTKYPGFSSLAFWYFAGILLQYMNTILRVAALNSVLIERLGSPVAATT